MQKAYRPSLRLLMITFGILAVFVLSARIGSTPGQAAANQAAGPAEIAKTPAQAPGQAPVLAPVEANTQAVNQPNEPIGEAVIGDFVWLDTSLNGLEDTGEPGIPGVFLRLWQDDNDFVFDPAKDTYLSTTVTADGTGAKQAGFYQFNVNRGLTYWVEVMDSNFDPGGPLHNYMLTSGPLKGDEPMIVPFVDADGTDVIDFGYAPTGIALVKRAGSAPNGGVHYIPQAGANVTFTYVYTNTGLTELINVEITDDNGTPADTGDDFQVCTVAKLIAGASGTCTAANRPISANHTNIATIVGTPTVNFELGKEVSATDNAVVALFASVGDRVWNDTNSNGSQDTGELGVPGVTVELFNGAGQSQGITTTNASGNYRFDNLPAGQYKVKFFLPAGYQFSPMDNVADDTKDSDANPANGETAIFTLQAGDVQLQWDAGIFNNAGIGDRVWEDMNANGIQDDGEPGIDNVTVRLFSGAGVELDSTTTVGGIYRFGNLVGGDYYLVFDAPGGYSFTIPNVPGDDTKDSDFDPALGRTAIFNLPAGQSNITLDAGLYRPASLGDRVWQDLDANGIQDSGEPNIPGVTVELYNSVNAKIDTKVTNGSGIYGFTGLTPGQYDVKFVQPSGYLPTLQNQGGDDALDSDASPTTGRTGLITLVSGQEDLTWDGGFYVPGAINVVKTANPTTIVSGQLVTYTYVITNSGGLPIQNVTVTDDKCSPVSARVSGDSNSDDRLDLSESWLYRCSTTLTQTTTNTVTAAGTDLAANPVEDTDTAVVTVVTPAINVVKTANPTVILANQNVAYTFVVTNPGNVPLSSVTVGDNKCANVVYQGGDANTNSVLETTETWTYACTQALSVTTTNIVTASGQPASPAGVPLPGIGRVQDTDTVTVTVIAPAIAIVKTVAPATVYANGTVTYTFRVSNTGNVTLGTVAVADNRCSPLTRTGGDTNSNNRLEVGEIWTYTCSRTLAQDTVNTATVTGQPVDGSGVPIPGVNPVSDQDSATANVINPAIRIVKSASASVVNQGDSVTYTLDVSNMGDDPLTSVTTTDNKCSPLAGPTPVAPANGDNILEPGETWRYTCTAVLTQDTTNIASTQGMDSLGKPVTDTDEIFVDVITAGIQVEKIASAPLVYSGSMVTYTFQVSNTGVDALHNVVVTDDKCSPISARLSGDTNSDNMLDSGEIWLYSCAKALTQTTVNVATVTGLDPLNNPQSDQSSATVRVISPAINVAKSVDKTVIVSGTQVIYSYLVTNPGNDPLSSVTLSDDRCAPVTGATPNPGDVANVGKLDPGEKWTYSCTTALTQTTLNTVTAAGVDSLGGPVQDTDTANVTVVTPGISIVKSVDKSVVRAGTAVVYTYVVKNTGDVPLASLNLTDDKCTPLARQSGDANSNNVLETTETWTYTCQSTISQTTVNVAVATGQPSDPAGVPLPGINPVTDQDTATVRVINPGINVVKSATPTTIYTGNSVTYNYSVSNTGDSTLNTVAISDDKCSPVAYVSGDTNNNQQMEVTEVWAYRCTTSLVVDTLNTVTVNAKDESGGDVTDTDTAQVNVINPGIVVDKQTTATAVSSGTVVTYTYAVTNSGDDPLSSVTVTDDKCSPVTFVNGDTNSNSRLDLTEVWNYICATPLTATTTNIATATGNDSLGNPVNDTDTVTVQVFGLATIGDRVWLDSNANGIQDASETSGVAGALVTLYQNNTVVMTQTTPANGSYLFSGLIPGDYSVGVSLPAGYRFSPQGQGGDPAKDSDVNVNTGRMAVTTLTSGETDRTWDAGLYRPASLGDRVWEDRNGNGIQDTGEAGLGGVTVLLYNSAGGLVTSATTQPDGSYLFDNLTPGTYQIQVTPPQSYLFTLATVGSDRAVDSNVNPGDGKSEMVTLVSGDENRTIDAGLYRLASLGDRVWVDTNQDGIQNNNEAGINGVTVTLFKGNGAQVMTKTTSAGGIYLFTGLTPGSYYVQVQLLPDYIFTSQYAGTDRAADSNVDPTNGRTETIVLSSGDVNLTLDAGLVVAAPRIQSIKTAELAVDDDNNGVVSPGDTLTYRIVISNIGTAPATNVGFSDGLDPNTSLVVGSVATDRGTVVLGNSAGNTSVQVAVGTLLPTESATIVLRTRIHNPLPAGVTQIVNQGVVSTVELPDEPTDDDGLGGGTGDPTVAPVLPRGFRLYMPFLSAQPPAAPTPTPSPTPSPTPTPDGGGGGTGIPCDAPGCALPDLIHPKSMAVNVSKNLLYVVSRDNDRLLKVDPQTMQVMNTALTGDEPWGVVVNEATNLVYVGNFASADVWVYNADTLALVTKIRLGNPGELKPALMELLPSLNMVAVVLHGGNGVALIQGLTLTQIVGATGVGTYGIAVDVVNNRIFVSNRDAGNTRVIYRTEFGQWKNDGYEFTYSDRRVLFELAYNPNNKRLYSVYVINTDWFVDTYYERSNGSWGLLATTPVGRGGGARDPNVGGTGLVVNLVTGHVFNTNSADNTVTVMNANGQVLATVATGVDPFTAVVNPATQVVFVGMRDARDTVNPDTVQKIIDNY